MSISSWLEYDYRGSFGSKTSYVGIKYTGIGTSYTRISHPGIISY